MGADRGVEVACVWIEEEAGAETGMTGWIRA